MSIRGITHRRPFWETYRKLEALRNGTEAVEFKETESIDGDPKSKNSEYEEETIVEPRGISRPFP